MSAPATVLVVTPSLGRGGAERHAVLLATHVDRARWTPHVLTMSDGPLRAELEEAGIEVTVAGTGHGLRSLRAATAAVRASVERLDPDLISAHDVLVELAVRAEVRQRPRALLVWKHTYGHIGYRGLRDRVMESLTHARVTTYGAVCHTQVRYLTDDLGVDPRRIRVLANTVQPVESTPAPDGPPVVAMVAAMRADKGHRSALHAWARVVERTPDARLALIGDGPLRGELEDLVVELGLGSNVEFVGETSEVASHVAQARALLVASYSIECFPYAALEAMAAGRAVIATDVGGLPEMVEDGVTGVLVPPHDDVALARALEGVVADPARARELGEAGRLRMARAFPFDRWVTDLHDLLDETVDRSAQVADAAAIAH